MGNMVESNSILIEEFDNRCQEVFQDSGERCWCIATKVITYNDTRKNICSCHYEQWLERMANLSNRLKGG
jgi:hypothetical protein